MNEHEKMNYAKFPAKDIEVAKRFFAAAFSCSFVDYDPDYSTFSNEGIDGVL